MQTKFEEIFGNLFLAENQNENDFSCTSSMSLLNGVPSASSKFTDKVKPLFSCVKPETISDISLNHIILNSILTAPGADYISKLNQFVINPDDNLIRTKLHFNNLTDKHNDYISSCKRSLTKLVAVLNED